MNNVVLTLLFACSLLSGVYCEDELLILHSPNAILFRGRDELFSSRLKDVFSAALGYSTEVGDQWSGMEVKKPFGWAEALVVLHFPGLGSLNAKEEGSFPLIPDESIEETWTAMSERTEMRYVDKPADLKRVIIEDQIEVYANNEPFTELNIPINGPIESISSSKPNSENDNLFINELNKMHAVIDQILSKKNKDGVPDMYWITVPKMSKIIQLRASDSSDILLNALKTLTEKIRNIYNEKVLIAVITENDEQSGSRPKRQVISDTVNPNSNVTLGSLNVAANYDENFPVIFNIMLWFSLGLMFSLIAICMVIAGMDPGRDSIIYRMTSTRMKKDN